MNNTASQSAFNIFPIHFLDVVNSLCLCPKYFKCPILGPYCLEPDPELSHLPIQKFLEKKNVYSHNYIYMHSRFTCTTKNITYSECLFSTLLGNYSYTHAYTHITNKKTHKKSCLFRSENISTRADFMFLYKRHHS